MSELPDAAARQHVLDGLVRRVSASSQAEALVLRGGLLTRLLVGEDRRSTEDADFLGRIRGGPAARTDQLSPRETEVLALVARGLTNAEIGRTLYVGEATVKTHLLRASAKLGVSGRTAAVTKAIETGALPAPGRPDR